jgi:hypothetical protein
MVTLTRLTFLCAHNSSLVSSVESFRAEEMAAGADLTSLVLNSTGVVCRYFDANLFTGTLPTELALLTSIARLYALDLVEASKLSQQGRQRPSNVLLGVCGPTVHTSNLPFSFPPPTYRRLANNPGLSGTIPPLVTPTGSRVEVSISNTGICGSSVPVNVNIVDGPPVPIPSHKDDSRTEASNDAKDNDDASEANKNDGTGAVSALVGSLSSAGIVAVSTIVSGCCLCSVAVFIILLLRRRKSRKKPHPVQTASYE